MVVLTFTFAGKSGVNSGIISTIFCTSVIFSNILFYILYGQKLSKYDIFGSLMIVASVVLIGFGGATGGSETDTTNLILALGISLATGFIFTLNAININYILQTIQFPAS